MTLKFYMRHLPLSPLCTIYKTLTTLDHEQQRARVYNSWVSKLKTTLKTQIEISFLAFVFRVAEKSKVSGIFKPWKSARCVVAGGWCVLFCFPAGSSLERSPWSLSGPEGAPVICIFKLFLISGKFSWFCLVYCSCYTRCWLYLKDTCKPLSSTPRLFSPSSSAIEKNCSFHFKSKSVAVLTVHRVRAALHCFQWGFNSSTVIPVPFNSSLSQMFSLDLYPPITPSFQLALSPSFLSCHVLTPQWEQLLLLGMLWVTILWNQPAL